MIVFTQTNLFLFHFVLKIYEKKWQQNSSTKKTFFYIQRVLNFFTLVAIKLSSMVDNFEHLFACFFLWKKLTRRNFICWYFLLFYKILFFYVFSFLFLSVFQMNLPTVPVQFLQRYKKYNCLFIKIKYDANFLERLFDLF